MDPAGFGLFHQTSLFFSKSDTSLAKALVAGSGQFNCSITVATNWMFSCWTRLKKHKVAEEHVNTLFLTWTLLRRMDQSFFDMKMIGSSGFTGVQESERRFTPEEIPT